MFSGGAQPRSASSGWNTRATAHPSVPAVTRFFGSPPSDLLSPAPPLAKMAPRPQLSPEGHEEGEQQVEALANGNRRQGYLTRLRRVTQSARRADRLSVLLPAAVMAVVVLSGPDAVACSVCGCGDPLVEATEARPGSGTLRVALDFEYLTARARSDDDPTLTEWLDQETLRPTVVYSPAQFVNLVAQIPLVRKGWTLTGPGGEEERAAPIGLGDIEVGARLFIIDDTNLSWRSRTNLGVLGGVAFPTGPDGAASGGQRIDQHAQLGTGAFGPYAGVFQAFHRDPWNLYLSATFRTHTTNSYGYRFGDAVLWSAIGQYRFWERAALVAGLEGRYACQDRSGGDIQENTGGTVVAGVPGLSVGVTDDLWIHARVQFPFATHLFGEQGVGPTWLVTVQQTLLQ
jgi:hypothetical protein